VTPAGAFGLMVAEDALDRYFIRRVEGWTTNRPLRVVTRVLFNPSRSLSNFAQGQLPWYRPARSLNGR
jgi:hypothetical protein